MIRLVLAAAFTLSAFAGDAPLFNLYSQYEDAIAKGDLAQAKTFLAKAKIESLADKDDEDALAALDVLSPKQDLRVHKEIIDGDDATLIVLAKVEENEAVGRIEMVRESGHWKILSELWDLGGNPDVPSGEVRQAKNDAQREAIRKLRARGFPSPSADFVVMTAGTGDLEALKLFVEAGYSVDTKDRGTPAIVNAAMFGQDAAVLYLIGEHADVNATDEVNTTALMRLADKCASTPTIRALLRAGAKTDGKTAGGATAAQLAEWAGCTDNLQAIKSAKPKK
ncbi:MAG TPA: ankyrin repeat domain-containing protein [Thermoanaerobaculia bacterium]|nr:ankyrin repeat domain-containing protein [Thermoanaerobaculia bacterium]